MSAITQTTISTSNANWIGTGTTMAIPGNSISWPNFKLGSSYYSKEDILKKVLYEIKSEERLRLIFEKVKEEKLTIEEAIAIMKGDTSINIG